MLNFCDKRIECQPCEARRHDALGGGTFNLGPRGGRDGLVHNSWVDISSAKAERS